MLSQTPLWVRTEVATIHAIVFFILPLHKVAPLEICPGDFSHMAYPALKQLVGAYYSIANMQIFACKAPAVKRAHAQNAKCARARTKFECSSIVKL
jgi:hypothetical protein